MPRNIHKTEKPVTLDGFQAIVAPSKFGYSLGAVVGDDLVNELETERATGLSVLCIVLLTSQSLLK